MSKQLIVSKEDEFKRLDHYLVEQVSEYSRSYLQQLIENQQVLVNGEPSKARAKVKEGDTIDLLDIEPKELEIEPTPMDLPIIYEDEDIIVINKPRGLIVHPSASTKDQPTLVHGLLAHCQDLSPINGVMRPGIVHRIDKDTSGLIVVAKSDLAHHALSEQLKDKTMHRQYLALVNGEFKHQHAKIDAPIGRDEKDRQKMTVSAKNSKAAITHVKIREKFKRYTLLECQLETGRTHQIRVHLKYIGFPIVGDEKYARKNEFGIKGQLLHAYQLELVHPRTNEPMTFEAPLPELFEKTLEQIRFQDQNEGSKQ